MGLVAAARLCAVTFTSAAALALASAATPSRSSKGSRPATRKSKKPQGPLHDSNWTKDGLKTKLRFVEALTPEGFAEKVQKVANGSATSNPPYYPLVMFHVGWCEHCVHALPEFDKAAEKVTQTSSQVGRFQVLPKFFSFRCIDENLAHRELCSRHAGGAFPAVLMFRDKRKFQYNRPRIAATIAWWAMRVTRPPVTELASSKHLDIYKEEVIFILKAEKKKDATLIEDWSHVALNYIDEYTLVLVSPTSEIGRSLPRAPCLHVRAPLSLNLEPLPHLGAMSRQTLEAWVTFNRFPPIVELNAWSLHSLRKTGIAVVTLVHAGGPAGSKAQKDFKAKVKQLRHFGMFLFAWINAAGKDSAEVLENEFPLLAPSVTELPRVFVFLGKSTFWEDQRFVNPADITIESLEDLMTDVEARQDDSIISLLKMKRKHFMRTLPPRSWTSLAASACAAFCGLGFCGLCVRVFFGSEHRRGPIDASKVEHVD